MFCSYVDVHIINVSSSVLCVKHNSVSLYRAQLKNQLWGTSSVYEYCYLWHQPSDNLWQPFHKVVANSTIKQHCCDNLPTFLHDNLAKLPTGGDNLVIFVWGGQAAMIPAQVCYLCEAMYN